VMTETSLALQQYPSLTDTSGTEQSGNIVTNAATSTLAPQTDTASTETSIFLSDSEDFAKPSGTSSGGGTSPSGTASPSGVTITGSGGLTFQITYDASVTSAPAGFKTAIEGVAAFYA